MTSDKPLLCSIPFQECSKAWAALASVQESSATGRADTAASEDEDSDWSEDNDDTSRTLRASKGKQKAHQYAYAGIQPAWAARYQDRKEIACYDCARHAGQSLLVVAFTDGSLHVYTSSDKQKEMPEVPTSPRWPGQIPASNLLPLSLKSNVNKRARHHSITSSSQRSVSPPPSSIASSSRGNRRSSTSTVRPRKASATVQISGSEATVTSSDPQGPRTSLSSGAACEHLRNAAHAEHTRHEHMPNLHSMNKTASESRDSLMHTWAERSNDSIAESVEEEQRTSPRFDLGSTDEDTDEWMQTLQSHCKVSLLDLHATPVKLAVLASKSEDEAGTAYVLFSDASLGRLSLKDGRFRYLHKDDERHKAVAMTIVDHAAVRVFRWM